MYEEIETRNWDIYDYLFALRRKDYRVYPVIARSLGFSIGKGIVDAGITLQEGAEEMIKV